MGKFKIALIPGRNRHDRTRAIAHQDVISNPDRDVFAGHRVGGMCANKHAGFFAAGFVLRRHRPGQFHLCAVSCDRILGISTRQFIDQRMFRGQHHIGRAKNGIGARGINRDFVAISAGQCDREVDTCANRTADPALLHFHNAVGPIQPLKVANQTVGIIGNAQHPLFERTFIHRVITAFGFTVIGDFFVRQNRAQHRAPINRHLIDIGQTPAINCAVNF